MLLQLSNIAKFSRVSKSRNWRNPKRQRRRPRDMSPSWSDLPEDLLSRIAGKLENRMDILRWRSVCPSWRSSIPPFRRSTHFPINLPSRIHYLPEYGTTREDAQKRDLILYENTIYRLDPPASNSNSENSSSWLLRIQETTPGRVRIQNPLSKGFLRPLPSGFQKVFNLRDFRVSELCKVYNVLLSLGFPSPRGNNVSRVALSSRPKSSNDDYVLLAINGRGYLCSVRLGDGQWTLCQDDRHTIFDDIINFNGKFYAVDKSSRIVVLDELSLKLIEVFEPAIIGRINGGYFRLVKSSEDLFLVYCNCKFKSGKPEYDFRFFKLNQEKHDLVEVYSFGDQVLFLGDEFSFSVSTREFTGLEPDCLYFFDKSFKFCFNFEVDGVGGNLGSIGVYKLWDGKVGSLASCPDCSKIFWPPPAWLQPGPSAST